MLLDSVRVEPSISYLIATTLVSSFYITGCLKTPTAYLVMRCVAVEVIKYTLSNYALCKALKGDNTQAQQLIDAANYRNRTGHGRAVILFNEALIRLKQGDEPTALSKLTEAVRLSPKAIKRYCERSVHFDILRQSPAFHELMNDV